jgi:hypothetical protein
LDHFRKPSNFEGKIPKKEHLFASQDKVASVEILLMMKSEDGTNEIHVYQRKNRLMNEIPPFKINMEDKDLDDGTRRTFMTYGGELDDGESAKESVKEFLLGFLEKEGRDTHEIMRAVNSAIKVGQKNTRLALQELVQEGTLTVGKQGKKNFYKLKDERVEQIDLTNDEDLSIFDFK